MESQLNKNQIASIVYHNIFAYPLNSNDLNKWATTSVHANKILKRKKYKISKYKNYYFLANQKHLVAARLNNEKESIKKIEIAKRGVDIISQISSVLFVGITGSVAMQNANNDSDIDLMIITKKGTLWTTRFLVYLKLRNSKLKIRKPNLLDEKDKLCINLWLDETSLEIQNKNIYTAHEIAQIIPLFQKDKIYEKLLIKNTWILDFWPNSVKIGSIASKATPKKPNLVYQILELIAFQAQKVYMSGKHTREIIKPNMAFFHPKDWSKKVKNKLKFHL